MTDQNTKQSQKYIFIVIAVIIAFIINPILGFVAIWLLAMFSGIRKTKFNSFKSPMSFIDILKTVQNLSANQKQVQIDDEEGGVPSIDVQEQINQLLIAPTNKLLPSPITVLGFAKKLEKKKKYLHIALNSTLQEAQEIISQLPASERILIEAGTPLIKIYGASAVSEIKSMAPGAYIVADNKCADLAAREVEIMANAGASAATCLGVAPVETIDSFIEECKKFGIDSMLDMMNVDNALMVLKKLKNPPDVVMLHRGVDETEFSKEKQIPYYQIKQIKGSYDILVAVAGGDTIKEVQRAFFNDADIVVVWKNFYQPNSQTALLAKEFLKEIE